MSYVITENFILNMLLKCVWERERERIDVYEAKIRRERKWDDNADFNAFVCL